MKSPLRRVAAMLPRDQYEQLGKLAVANERSMAAEVRLALRDHLRRRSDESRDVPSSRGGTSSSIGGRELASTPSTFRAKEAR